MKKCETAGCCRRALRFSLAFVGNGGAFANGLTGETFLLYLGEGVTAFAAAYFFSTAQYVLENGKPVRGVTLEEASAVLGSGFLIMCSLSGLTVLEVSPARMIMVFGVLFSPRFIRRPAVR